MFLRKLVLDKVEDIAYLQELQVTEGLRTANKLIKKYLITTTTNKC